MSAARNLFTTTRTEGALLPADFLQHAAEGDREIEGLSPESYHLVPGEKLNEAINRSWNRLLGAWTGFKDASEKLAFTVAGHVRRLVDYKNLGAEELLARYRFLIGI